MAAALVLSGCSQQHGQVENVGNEAGGSENNTGNKEPGQKPVDKPADIPGNASNSVEMNQMEDLYAFAF